MKSVILAGSPGKEISLLTRFTPKFGLSLLGKMLVEYSIEPLSKITRDIILVVAQGTQEYYSRHLEKYMDKVNLTIVEQRGSGINNALKTASPYIEDSEDTMVVYGDIISDYSLFEELIDEYTRISASLLATTVPLGTGLETYGNVYLDTATQRISLIEEKPRVHTGKTSFVLGGVFIGKWRTFEEMSRYEDIISYLNNLADKGEIYAHIWTGSWVDINYPWDMLEAVKMLLDKEKESRISRSAKISNTAVIEGIVIIEDEAKIDHYAVIKGPVYIGKNAFVGAHTLIREYSSIEADAVVGARSELKRSIIMNGAFVSSNAYLADSIVGEKATIQPNVTTLSVYKGELAPRLKDITYRVRKIKKLGSVIGAGCILKAGEVLPAGSLVE